MQFMKNETLFEYILPSLGQTLVALKFKSSADSTLDRKDFKAADRVVEAVIDIYNRRHIQEQYRRDWREFVKML